MLNNLVPLLATQYAHTITYVQLDNAPEFTSQRMKDFLLEHGVQGKTCSPSSPNGPPERRYRDWLEANKPEEIFAAEREFTKSDQETWAGFLERFVTSYDIARTYYSSTKYKRKQWDADKAKRGELARVLEGIVNMVDESIGYKLSGNKKVIVAIGMSDFSSAKSRHVMFTRDVMAADNIVRGYLEHDERPAYLKPPSKDKNSPMKRRADEGGTSRGGPSKSRKTR
ncbi:hypothetical protein SeLEV6574_g00733 [Synchytrium endobioticum]|uniref:Integrase catalytic domain-containing protein n=1 Tax=Synchytrium endobioticum TaxID=286115 RepID=A0A507DGK5_9FUNG|nr:hypothetical protein SeLEV6574_g00733 [Synchytrium endobioticum]